MDTQGSSARRVVVPIYRSRVLDRAWVYTAITRAEEICVLVGDVAALRTAIIEPPSASRRMHRFLPSIASGDRVMLSV
jgi:exodeoxyribonuclease V alpha subunit